MTIGKIVTRTVPDNNRPRFCYLTSLVSSFLGILKPIFCMSSPLDIPIFSNKIGTMTWNKSFSFWINQAQSMRERALQHCFSILSSRRSRCHNGGFHSRQINKRTSRYYAGNMRIIFDDFIRCCPIFSSNTF